VLRARPDWTAGDFRLLGFLIALAIVPAACVLWFMSNALATESTAAEERMLGAYRGQLRLVREQLDALWRMQAERLNAAGDSSQSFERLMTRGVADGAVLLDASGYVSFPWTDVRGDLAEIDARVAAIARLDAPARDEAIRSVAARLNDYGRHLPAGDRLRLMDDLQALAPDVPLPTHAALQLSLDMVDAERPEAVPDVVRKTSLPDVWALTSADRHAIGLYRTGRLETMVHDFLRQASPRDVAFLAYPPGNTADAEAIAAGPWLPGWQLSFKPVDRTVFTNDVRRRRTFDVSIALAGIGVILVGVVLGGRTMRRHLQVARLKTDLVAAASHELRTPLASMRVLVDGLLADRELDPVKTREYLQLLAIENDRLSRLIANFLTFARLDRRQQQFTRVPVAPADIVSGAVDAIRDRLPQTCDLRVEVEKDLPPVLADRDGLTTALINLLDNALKYSPPDKRITVSASRQGSAATFAVSDNGIGIAPREQRRIFRRFYRVDRRLTSPTSGVGLGLSIVELIASGHDGDVTVRSQPGVGSTFTLRVSLAEGTALNAAGSECADPAR
jgi:signal transduction histidine kinase